MSEENSISLSKEPTVADNAPSGMERLCAVVCHTGAFLGLNIIIPAIFMLAIDKAKMPFTHQHAKQALAFQIITSLIVVCLVVGASFTAGVGIIAALMSADVALPLSVLFLFLITAIFGIASLILVGIASYKAATGQPYKYPFLGRF